MKILVLMALALGSVTANAHEITPLKKAASPILEKFRTYTEKLCKQEYTACNSYQVKRISPVKDGETAAQTYYRVLKYSLHRDFPITGDDGGYSFDIYTKGVTQSQIDKSLSYVSYFESLDSNSSKTISTFIKAATNAGLIVYIGNGAGNNTSADILTLVDPVNHQLVYLIASNFGSDN
jgi:hypothetical protein